MPTRARAVSITGGLIISSWIARPSIASETNLSCWACRGGIIGYPSRLLSLISEFQGWPRRLGFMFRIRCVGTPNFMIGLANTMAISYAENSPNEDGPRWRDRDPVIPTGAWA